MIRLPGGTSLRLIATTTFFTALFIGSNLTIVKSLRAQELRVYTSVMKPAKDKKPAETISHSLTLFHAGKSYDLLTDMEELVICDPMTREYTLFNGHALACRISFDEIQNFVKKGRAETVRYIEEAEGRQSPPSTIKALRFQLDPKFEENFNVQTGQLKMVGEGLRYEANTSATGTKEQVERYLEYADCTARLNFVLHPNSPFPAARLALNESLRKHRSLPLVVERVDFDDVDIRAEHRYGWSLQPLDKSLINKWGKLLMSEQLKWVSLHEYQQRLLKPTAKN